MCCLIRIKKQLLLYTESLIRVRGPGAKAVFLGKGFFLFLGLVSQPGLRGGT